MPMRILLLDDDLNLNNLITKFLQDRNYEVDGVTDVFVALEKIKENHYDLMILDIMLPDLDGINLCLKLRKENFNLPILLITALQSKSDLIKGFKAGADDYLIKPFDWDEFFLRIEALIKRNIQEEKDNNSSIITLGDFYFNPENKQVFYQEKLINFTSMELKIFTTLFANQRKIFSPDYLINICWDLEEIPTQATIRTHIKKIRKKLQIAGANHDLIETVYGVGYKLNPDKATTNQPLKSQRQQISNKIDRLFEQFKESLITHVDNLKQYLEGSDIIDHQEAIILAHNLAGTLGNFTFLKDTSILCSQIENQLKKNTPQSEIIEDVNQVYHQIISAKSSQSK